MNRLFTIKYDEQVFSEDVFDITNYNNPILKEFNAFREFCNLEIYKNFEFSGIVSPKFENKLGISKQDALNFVDANFDVILFHPYPLELKIQRNFLQLAEHEHSGITTALKRLWFQLYNEELPYVSLPENLLYCVHCNYFIATKLLWEEYSKIIFKIDYLYKNGELSYLFDYTKYNLSDREEYFMELFPFVFERLFTHFLYKNKEKFKIKNISLNSIFKPVLLFKFEDIMIKILSNIGRKDFSVTIYFHFRRVVFRLLNKLRRGKDNE